ncbi:M48 family metallopeptidase [Ulvibacter litoralis]|uniref:STE24 endopeptidase n=1 Tax=Ulvibacter litoralis TaxID=227084 RepID=A0A1G7ERC9_9FLAO|nr:M48 family metallopeptidase [Ulvibacter litoralis]GHC54246.1 peptidase M48 [Ulvibacter litoralis]SDE65996.1 STE24 endopeptidase [Ulvibacter litoralis]
MSPQTIFYSIIGILVISFLIDKLLDFLNAKHYNDPIPEALKDVFNKEEYTKSQQYKKENYRFTFFTSTISLVATLAFFFLDGFAFVDTLARSFSENSIVVALLFFGIIMLASDILSTPFSFYHTFVIEEKYGFNKTSKKTFIIDKLKGWLMLIVIGGLLLSVIVWFYETAGTNFWLYAWGLVTVFTLFMNLFYARLLVPLFNKQSPLEEGALRSKIETYASKVGFTLDKIFVIDGSKRSTKANAYFSGFGSEKRVTLYDTLINDLEEDEIVAVLAHEVGHYKKNHILINLAASIVTTGFTFWILSQFVGNSALSEALNVSQPSFHIGLIAFGVLFSPISEITSLIMNYLSRKFEYQADNYAKTTFSGAPLVSALKKLSKNSLSNLTPHPAYVFAHYSHPTLLQRFQNLERNTVK